MAELNFELPVWFRATPVKHRNPKMVSGVLHETFDIPDVDPEDVSPAMSLEIGGAVNEFCEIDGRFYLAVDAICSDSVKSRFKADNSPIPGLAMESHEMKGMARKKAKDAGLPMYPNPADPLSVVKREWFSETDLEWIDKRREAALTHLLKLRCSNGILYEPMPEPVFVVGMVSTWIDVKSITIDFRASNAKPIFTGSPVAYFRADQQEAAISYADALAHRHGVGVESFTRRNIVVHDAQSLSLDPFPHHVLEAASNVMAMNVDNTVVGDRQLADDIGAIIGSDRDAWRNAPPGTFDEQTLSRLEGLVRGSIEQNKTVAPPVLVKALMERWDERPVSLSAILGQTVGRGLTRAP